MSMTRRSILTAAGIAAVPSLSSGLSPAPEFTLPQLPYAADALEPYIDAQTMEIHHGKHHQAYVNNLNKVLAGHADLQGKSVEQLLESLSSLPESIRTAVRNNGGGHANHSLFWQNLAPAAKSGRPGAGLAAALQKAFGGQEEFENRLRAAATSVFGSGWAWLSLAEGKKLELHTTANQDHPVLSGKQPLLGIDVWEHAYYLKYQNRRADYLAAVVRVINWDNVSQRFAVLSR